MSSVLGHLRVLDLSRILAGPWATQIFADLGAEVIKIERPGHGDDTRTWGPPYLQDEAGRDTADAAYFLGANRGKKSLTLNIASPKGAAIVRELAQQADVLVENFKVGDMKRYGLDYESLKAINSGLIYCSITGFGQSGPYRKRAGYDFIVQGMGGLMSITGPAEGAGGACKVGVPIADLMTGMYATTAILAALSYRERGGGGQYIDMALLDVQVGFLANQNMNYLTTGQAPKRMGNAHPNIVPYQTFDTSDGTITLGVGNDGQFAKFCEVAGLDRCVTDPRFATHAARIIHREALVPIVAQAVAKRPSAFWIEALETRGVPCGPVNDLKAVFNDPQVLARGMKVQLPHAAAGHVDLVANPIKFSETPITYTAAPPRLGEHTQQILTETLHMNPQQIKQLEDEGIV